MKYSLKKIIIITALCFSIFQLSFARDFIIAGIPEAPLRFHDSTGKPTGIDVDIISYIMDKMGIKYKILLVNSSTRLLALSKAGKYDIVFTYSYNKDRNKYLYYPKESHVTITWNFFILRKNEGKIKYNSFEDLRGYYIGATKGFSYTPEFWEAASKGILTLDTVVKNKLQMRKLLGGRIDLLPYNTNAALYEAHVGGFSDKITYLKKPLKKRDYFNTFPRKSDYPNMENIKKKYDEILRKMKEDGTLVKIYAKYGIKYSPKIKK
ncbi:substrate-binding periplasmic protein [Haliovirga abyssi]|uniref:Glutamine transporter substrate-binding protein n=1 Tax=Haliovirga abyssi TaxID=2996794 RepID=A0AAU9DA90_9FUSO|nr:transporter substrate-binding domain-containing protein [Haliovirga abyssi]BDU51558.1 glutamine transporter substrate-binding protein [Haliovirga abyssi]